MHLIVVRRDLTGFQHLHPKMNSDGVWSTPITLSEPGAYRVLADFNRGGEDLTLGGDVFVDGNADYAPLPHQATETETNSGYEVGVEGRAPRAGETSELKFNVLRDGRPVKVDPYLGAGGHLVALREGDLAFLHVHPSGGPSRDGIRFETEFPTAGSYRLFLLTNPQKPRPFIVGEHAGEVVGWARAREVLRSPRLRGRGRARGVRASRRPRAWVRARVLDALATEAERHGIYKLTGRVFTDNEASLAAHRAAGFEVVGIQRRHGKLDGRWKDCALVERLLGEAAET